MGPSFCGAENPVHSCPMRDASEPGCNRKSAARSDDRGSRLHECYAHGRRPVRSTCSVEIDPNRGLQRSGFRPANRADRKRKFQKPTQTGFARSAKQDFGWIRFDIATRRDCSGCIGPRSTLPPRVRRRVCKLQSASCNGCRSISEQRRGNSCDEAEV
jgi:hypothetical protein